MHVKARALKFRKRHGVHQETKVKDHLDSSLATQVGERNFGQLISHYASYVNLPTKNAGTLDHSPYEGYTTSNLAECLPQVFTRTPSPKGCIAPGMSKGKETLNYLN